jgi:hypothetical protein
VQGNALPSRRSTLSLAALRGPRPPRRAPTRRVGAVGTHAVDDEVNGLGKKFVVFPEMGTDSLDKVTLVVENRATGPADEVELVVGVSDLPVAFAVPKVDGLGELELLEQGEGPVDAGDVEVGDGLGYLSMNLLGGEMRSRTAQHVPDELALRGKPVTLGTEAVSNVHALIMPVTLGMCTRLSCAPI